jgi:hypothetical protein
MGADQVAEIRPAIVEVLEGAESGGDWCATLTDSTNSSRWVQVTRDMLNMAYPHDHAPSPTLESDGPTSQMHLADWRPGSYATFTFEPCLSARALAQVVDRLFVSILGSGPDYSVDVEVVALRK